MKAIIYAQKLFVFLFLFSLMPAAQGGRMLDPAQYAQAYYDSIRAAVNDTTFEHYVIHAYRIGKNERIHIDGKLDESAWHKAEHAGHLVEKEPYPLIRMSEKTEFAILYDDKNVYVGVWCWDHEPKKIVRQINPRGTASPDNIYLFFDTYFDHRTGYKFNVSPTGVQSDELRYDDFKRDRNWNGVWTSAARIDDRGWYAEVKIPFFNLRFRDVPQQTWGFNIMRNISKDGSRGQWKPHLPEWENTTRMSMLGQIVGIENIKTGRKFEIRPYALAGNSQTAPKAANAQFNYGMDVRFSPATNITTDVTVNPDFAQVDADVLDINLTRFPTRFPELRPFFTERTNVFNTPLELFYSRRIGAKGDILGGVKMTGKLQKGFEFGALGAMTGNSGLSHDQSLQMTAEKAGFSVVRFKKDLFKSGSIGLLGAMKENGDRFNRILGVDGSFTLRTQYLLDVQIATGQTEEQRHKNTALYALLRRTGDNFGFTAGMNYLQPFFEINRIGYIKKEKYRGSNDYTSSLWIGPRLNKHHLRRISFIWEGAATTDIFTDRYINNWLDSNSLLNPDPHFGKVFTSAGSSRTVLGGERYFQNWDHQQKFKIDFMNEMMLSAGISHFKRTELTGPYKGKMWHVLYSSRPMIKGARYQATLGVNSGTYYNFTKKYIGTLKRFTMTGRGRLLANIVTSIEGERTLSYNLLRQLDGRYWRFSSYTTIMFTKDFYFRLHVQGNFGTTYYDNRFMKNKYLLSTLLSWEYQPGSFFYLAYNEGRLDEGDEFDTHYFQFNDRTLLLKLSYRVNI